MRYLIWWNRQKAFLNIDSESPSSADVSAWVQFLSCDVFSSRFNKDLGRQMNVCSAQFPCFYSLLHTYRFCYRLPLPYPDCLLFEQGVVRIEQNKNGPSLGSCSFHALFRATVVQTILHKNSSRSHKMSFSTLVFLFDQHYIAHLLGRCARFHQDPHANRPASY